MFNKEECIKKGGHFWNYHGCNDIVNECGRNVSPGISTLMACNDRYRTCALCGTREILIPETWKEIENWQLKKLEEKEND